MGPQSSVRTPLYIPNATRDSFVLRQFQELAAALIDRGESFEVKDSLRVGLQPRTNCVG